MEGVEPTNNEPERQLRELVIYRKISLCIQSAIGQRFVESIFSVIATCKLHKIRSLGYLGLALNRSDQVARTCSDPVIMLFFRFLDD